MTGPQDRAPDPAADEETLDILSDPEALAEIRAAKAEADAGDVVTADRLRATDLDGDGSA